MPLFEESDDESDYFPPALTASANKTGHPSNQVQRFVQSTRSADYNRAGSSNLASSANRSSPSVTSRNVDDRETDLVNDAKRRRLVEDGSSQNLVRDGEVARTPNLHTMRRSAPFISSTLESSVPTTRMHTLREVQHVEQRPIRHIPSKRHFESDCESRSHTENRTNGRGREYQPGPPQYNVGMMPRNVSVRRPPTAISHQVPTPVLPREQDPRTKLSALAKDIGELAAKLEEAKEIYAHCASKTAEAGRKMDDLAKQFNEGLEEMRRLGSPAQSAGHSVGTNSSEDCSTTNIPSNRSENSKPQTPFSGTAPSALNNSHRKFRDDHIPGGDMYDCDTDPVNSEIEYDVSPDRNLPDTHRSYKLNESKPRTRSPNETPKPPKPPFAIGSHKMAAYFTIKSIKNMKAFSKKPRSMVLNPGSSGESDQSGLDSLIATSGLDGEVHLWNTSLPMWPMTKGPLVRIPPKALGTSFAEDLAWISNDALAVAGGHALKDPERGRNLAILHVFKTERIVPEYRVQHLEFDPHQIDAIAPVNAHPSGSVSFATAGEKSIYLWKLKRNQHWTPTDGYFNVEKPLLLNGFPHTSAIYSISYQPNRSTLYSGGADYKFYGVDIVRQVGVAEHKFLTRVNHITSSPADPNLLLLTMAHSTEQLNFCDPRKPNLMVLSTGFSNGENLSKYVTPSFHPNGWIVACGSHNGNLNFWDLRYAKLLGHPLQTEKLHSSRILKPLFDVKNQAMYTLSTDTSANFGVFNFAYSDS